MPLEEGLFSSSGPFIALFQDRSATPATLLYMLSEAKMGNELLLHTAYLLECSSYTHTHTQCSVYLD